MNKRHLELTSLFANIPPAHAMQITAAEYSENRLVVEAPLLPNINDKGTAFAGSISSMLALAGWGLITLQLREAGICADVMIAHSEITYRSPARADLEATARLDPAEMIERMDELLAGKTRGRVSITVDLHSEEILCATMNASYAIAVRY